MVALFGAAGISVKKVSQFRIYELSCVRSKMVLLLNS